MTYTGNIMSKYLSIKIKENPLGGPFMTVRTNIEWIYALSDNTQLLNEFRQKILNMTPKEYLQYMVIVVGSRANLTAECIKLNKLGKRKYTEDVFYLEGIVNNNEDEIYSLNEFTHDIWKFWD